MNLFDQTKIFWSWYFQVFSAFWRVRPGVFSAVVFFAVVERFCNLLAMVLPLKIVLLASAEGIPKYFQVFMEPGDKQLWIFGLSAAAIGFHLLGLGLSAFSDRLAAQGGAEVVATANEINVVNGREQKLKNYYSTFCRILSSATFALMALSVLVWLDDSLLIALLCSLALEYVFSAWAFRPLARGQVSKMSRFAKEELAEYLNFFTYANFIICFVVVLMPFVLGQPASVFGAVVSIILLRHAINALASIVKDSVKLWGWKDGIDPLVFRHVQVTRKELPEAVNFRQLLTKENREIWVRGMLPEGSSEGAQVSVQWLDSPQKGMNTFLVIWDSAPEYERRELLLQVVDTRWRHLVTNEQYLFMHVSREALLAPENIATVIEDGYAGQLLDVANGVRASNGLWRRAEGDILLEHWSYGPPKTLLSGYVVSHPLLHQRVTEDFIKKVSLATDTDDEVLLLRKFLGAFPRLSEILKALPLYIYNPDLHRDNVIVSGDGDEQKLVTSWGRWALEPIGVRLPSRADNNLLEGMLQQLRMKRRDLSEDFGLSHINIAFQMFRLEGLINGQKYKAALAEMAMILENSLLVEERCLVESA